jgi:cell division protein FtsQ
VNATVKKILKITGIVLIVTVLSGYAVFAAVVTSNYHPDKMCNNVVVNILDFDKYKFINESTVYVTLKKAGLNPVGRTVTHQMSDRIEKCVASINVVRSAICYVASNGDVVINITQRDPVYRVITPKRSYYVDIDRKTMPVSKTFTTLLPLVTGYVTEEMATGAVYDFITDLYSRQFWKNHIGQVNFTADGNIELITKIGAGKIIINDLSTYKTKLKQAEDWYKQYPKQAWSNKYSVVDMRYNNLIYCKKGGNK